MNKDSRKKIFPFEVDGPRKTYQFKLAFASAPHPHKVWKGGEDALFVSKNVLLIADGVGGWAKMGIDSGTYARRLVASVKELLHAKELYFIERPQELAVKAVQLNEEKGSATFSVLTLHPISGILRSYHIGDSVFGVFAKDSIAFMAQEQQRSFNVPFQVYGGLENTMRAADSDSEEEQSVSDVFRGVHHEFTPQQMEGKVVVLASDGLWDNLTPLQVQREVFGAGSHMEAVKALIKKTKEVGLLEDYESPFFLKAVQQGLQDVPRIGKVDDTTIIIASVLLQ